MTNKNIVLGFAGFLAICVVGLGFAGQFQPANVHDYDVFTGVPLTTAAAGCNDQGASATKPLAPLATRQ
jgi:hypothetical protein